MSEDRTALVRELASPLAEGKGWIKFLGIMTLISAALSILSSFGVAIIVAWLPIWMGILLLQSGSAIEQAQTAGDEAAMRRALGKMRTYFVIQGVLLVITLALVALALLFGLGAGMLAALQV